MRYNIPELIIARAGSERPAWPDAASTKVHTWRDTEGRVCAYGQTIGQQHRVHLPGLASFEFSSPSNHVIAYPWPCVQTDQIVDMYRRTVLPLVLQSRGQEVLHASGVLTRHGVVGLCAVSGTGKSTTAFGLGRRGYPLWADDALAFEASGHAIQAISLPFAIRLLPDAVSLFARDRSSSEAASACEEVCDLEPRPLAAVCVLDRAPELVHGAPIASRRLRSTPSFVSVLTHAYSFNPRDEVRKRDMVRHYLDLIARVPIFEIRFRAGLDTLPAVLDEIERVVIQAPMPSS